MFEMQQPKGFFALLNRHLDIVSRLLFSRHRALLSQPAGHVAAPVPRRILARRPPSRIPDDAPWPIRRRRGKADAPGSKAQEVQEAEPPVGRKSPKDDGVEGPGPGKAPGGGAAAAGDHG